MKRLDNESISQRIRKMTNGEYELHGNYINNKTKVAILHKSCNRAFYMRPDKFFSGHRCPYCSRNKKKDIAEMRHKIQLKHPDMFLHSEYTASTKPALFYHMDCGRTFHATPTDILRGKKCPFCSNKITGKSESFQNTLNSQFFGTMLLLESYKGLNRETAFTCTSCGSRFSAKPKNLLRYNSCPICADRSTKREIERFLDVAKIPYRRDELFFLGYIMKFDYFIPSMNLAIDYDGLFYYNKIRNIHSTMNDRKKRKMKTDYCTKNKIKLLRIPYWHAGDIDRILYDLFMDIDETSSYTQFRVWKEHQHLNSKK